MVHCDAPLASANSYRLDRDDCSGSLAYCVRNVTYYGLAYTNIKISCMGMIAFHCRWDIQGHKAWGGLPVMDPIFHKRLARTTPDAPVTSQSSYLIKIHDS